MSMLLLLMTITAQSPAVAPTTIVAQARTKAAPAPARARGPREEAIDWFASEADSAAAHLVASGRDQVTAFSQNVKDQPELGERLAAVVSPSAVARAAGGKVTVTASSVTIEMPNIPPLQYAFDGESTAGDRAFVPLTIHSGTQTARGSIELALEDGAWKVAAADLGPWARWPRFDSPAFIPETVDVITAALRKTRTQTLAARARAEVRSVQAAETAAQAVNGGFYLPLECLTKPKGCLPAYTGAAPLSELPELDGYTPKFVPGPAPAATQITRAKASRRSVKSWAFVLQPATSELPAFCADSSGRVCELPRTDSVTAPTCPATCK